MRPPRGQPGGGIYSRLAPEAALMRAYRGLSKWPDSSANSPPLSSPVIRQNLPLCRLALDDFKDTHFLCALIRPEIDIQVKYRGNGLPDINEVVHETASWISAPTAIYTRSALNDRKKDINQQVKVRKVELSYDMTS